MKHTDPLLSRPASPYILSRITTTIVDKHVHPLAREPTILVGHHRRPSLAPPVLVRRRLPPYPPSPPRSARRHLSSVIYLWGILDTFVVFGLVDKDELAHLLRPASPPRPTSKPSWVLLIRLLPTASTPRRIARPPADDDDHSDDALVVLVRVGVEHGRRTRSTSSYVPPRLSRSVLPDFQLTSLPPPYSTPQSAAINPPPSSPFSPLPPPLTGPERPPPRPQARARAPPWAQRASCATHRRARSRRV